MMKRTKDSIHGKVKSGVRGIDLPIILLILAALFGGCSGRESILFDDPEPKLVLVGDLGRSSQSGGTLYYGDVRNDGNLTAENTIITINVIGSGGASLGSYSASVGIDYDEEGEEIVDSLDPGIRGSFTLWVPVSIGQIVSEEISFSYTLPLEEE